MVECRVPGDASRRQIDGDGDDGGDDRLELEVRFERALDQLWLEFQPIVRARSGERFGVEALVRSGDPWFPDPHALLDAAGRLGRFARLGRTVRSLAAAAFAPPGDGALFVNLHPAELDDAELIDPGAPLAAIAARVILEVTEHAPLARSPALTAQIARLRALGYRIAVDDLGAGHSGLASLTELRPEVAKLDMSIVRGIEHSAWKQRTVVALCQLCHDMGALVVAEGIETADERDVVVELGCDLLQGHLLGRPARRPR